MEESGVSGAEVSAREKILGKGHPNPRKDLVSLALLSYRIDFDVLHHHLAEELVSGYLRYIVDISDDPRVLRTMQPSDPILADLSARQMQTRGEMRRRALETLHTGVVEGIIRLSDIGETVAALILLFAFDKLQAERLPTAARFSDFLASLLPKNKVLVLEGRMRDNEQMQHLWTDGYVFFNHFVRTTEKPTAETLRWAYQRGAVIFRPFGYKGCDIIIPVALPEDNVMNHFIILVKSRRDDALTLLSAMKPETQRSPPQGFYHRRPRRM
ncbi:hypothetical protein VTN00DRAFT_10275 [Thermoascus crustaceus]|uniref:uncharacterized protein n=1 Tax=Thermoascus crustaceus TaxID=5088 RepID=UPI0037430F34